MNITQAKDSDRERWDDFVHKHSPSTPFHLFAWTSAIQNAYRFRNFNLIAEDNNRVSGVFPMTMLKIPLKRPQLVALPYCDVGSPLGTRREVQAELLNKSFSIAQSNNVSMIHIRGEIDQDLLQNLGYHVQASSNKVRMILELPESAAELWKGFKSKLRSQVRKAEKNGLTFRFADENIDDFYSIFRINMRDLGSPVHSKKWFEEIIRQFTGNAKVGLVYHNNNAIGAGIILRVGNKISIPWASTLGQFNCLNPNMMLYWKFLEYAADSGARIFDFGRSTPDEGTYKFKAQWGARQEPLIWYDISLKKATHQTQSSPNLSREISKKIWQRFPLRLANLLGPLLRKYIKL
ncbi:MAG: FemAB family XrtA/PEP-CTERM system-associated protein [Pseudomonadota bacterium]